MRTFTQILVALSALAFILAVVAVLTHSTQLMAVTAEGYSRACTNLALIAIAVSVCFRKKQN